MIKFYKIILLFLLLNSVLNGSIIPDPYNPILFYKPFADGGGINEITIRFQLPKNSGLSPFQYIAMRFPDNDELLFDLKLPNGKYSCSLTDSDGVEYSVHADSNSESVAYCQLRDSQSLVGEKSYTLTFTLNEGIKFSRKTINVISIFTCTSNKQWDYIIIDSNPTFADAGLYPNFFIDKGIKLMLEIGILKSDISPAFYQNFNFKAEFIAYQRILKSQHSIVIKFPVGLKVYENVQFKSKDSSKIENLNLEYIKIEDEMNLYILNGLQNDILENKFFEISFQLQATDVAMNLEEFAVSIFYKNSYSLLSESKKSFFVVTPAKITSFTAENPDDWEIYDKAAWPFMFTFTSPIDLKSGGYFMIQQTNTLLKMSKLSFIGSTCDFSYTDSLSLEFGERPVCFPLRNDMNYPNQSNSVEFKGSAIIFKLPSVSVNQTIKFRVFAYAEFCGNTNLLFTPNRETQFAFALTIYKKMDMTKLNEARFNDSDIIAQTETPVLFKGMCYSALSKPEPFVDDDYPDDTQELMMREFHDFDYGVIKVSNAALCSDCLFTDLENNSEFVKGFLNNPPTLITNESFLSLKSDFKIDIGKNPINMIALPYKKVSNSWSYLSGSVVSYFSKDYLSKAGDNCYMSWGFFSEGNLKTQKILLNIGDENDDPITGGLKNIVARQNLNDIGYEIDNTNTSLNNSSSHFKISSVYDDGTHIKFITDFKYSSTTLTENFASLAYYTNCLRYDITAINKTKSIYDYMDFMLSYNISENDKSFKNNIRINRFFRFASSLGFFDLPHTEKSASLIKFHMVSHGYVISIPNLPSLDTPSVCLIEISSDVVNKSNTDNSNLLAIFINNLNLLDLDYTDIASTYPISANETNDSYAFPSVAFTMGHIDGGLLKNTINIDKFFNNVKNFNNVPRSVYYQYLGNLLLIRSDAMMKFRNNILIPVHCPLVKKNAENGPFFIPTIAVQWITSNTNNNKISSINSQFLDENGFSYFKPSESLQIKQLVSQNSPIYTTLRFNPYTIRDDNKIFFIPFAKTVSGIPSPPVRLYNCSGYSLFLSNKIKFDDSLVKYGLTINNSYFDAFVYSSTINYEKKFYWKGKSFSKAIYSSTPNRELKYNPSNILEQSYFSGIRRPTLEDLAITDSNNKISFPTTDIAAFYCVSSGNDEQNDANYFTNFNTNLYDIHNTNYFLLDWNPDDLSPWPTAQLSSDKSSEIIFKDDPAGNFLLTLTFPQNFHAAVGTVIRISSSYLISTLSLCGILDNNGNTSECNLTNNKHDSMDCIVPSSANTVKICCYSIQMSSDIPFPSVKVYAPPDPDVKGVENQIYDRIFSLPVSGVFWDNKNFDGIDLIGGGSSGSSFAKITNISYFNYFQEGAITKAMLTIEMPREVVRNMKIWVSGDIRKNIIPLIDPKCTATFDPNNPENGDVLLESCNVKAPVSGESIVITTKNLLYKCGESFSKMIYVYLWPIKVFKYEIKTPINFTVPMSMSGQNISNPSGISPLNYSGPTLVKTPAVIFEELTFCKLNSINPPVVGELADYNFSFDLNKNYKNIPKDITIDEMMIFFPFSSFPQDISANNTLKCYFKDILVDCSTIEDNILIIKLVNVSDNKKLSFKLSDDPSFKTPSVTVSGIINSVITGNTFICSLNNGTINGQKYQIINGTGSIKIKIEDKMEGGMLKLFEGYSTDPRPRIASDIIIKFVYDTTFRLSASEPFNFRRLSIPNDWKNLENANFIVTFPDDYRLDIYSQDQKNKIKVTISEYYFDDSYVLKSQIYKIEITSISSNKIQIKVNQSINLSNFHQYWEFKATNIMNPGSDVSTGRFRITLFSSKGDYIFKSYSNLNYIGDNLLKEPVDKNGFIRYGKGIQYTFGQKLHVIDIVSPSQNTVPLIIKPGRFTKLSFRLRQDPKEKIPNFSEANIKLLQNPIMGTDLPSYRFIIAIGNLDFYLGTPCETKSNIYQINFEIDNLNDFNPIEAVKIFVDESKGYITGPGLLRDVIKGGTQFITLKLSEPTYSAFNITYTQADGKPKNDVSALINTFMINPMDDNKRSKFQIENLVAVGFQYFKVNNPNSCYTLDYDTLTYNANAENTDIPEGYKLEKYLSFDNSETDPTIEKNSIKVNFTPNIAPLYIYCSLICSGRSFIKNSEFIDRADNNLVEPAWKESYITEYIPVSLGSYSFLFKNLYRGKQYKLKCAVQTTLKKNPKASYAELTKISGSIIKTENLFPTHCAQFTFYVDPAKEAKEAILKYCQKQFYGNDGCILCVDNENKTVKGMAFPVAYSCKDPSSRILDTLQASNYDKGYTKLPNDFIYDNNLGTSSYSYTVCATQNFMCPTNLEYPKSLPHVISDLIYDLKDEKGFEMNLGIYGIKVNSVRMKNDMEAPDISSIKKYIESKDVKQTGEYSIKFSNVPFSFNCNWLINSSPNPPLSYEMEDCSDFARCGTIKLEGNVTIKNDVTVRSFEINSYNIWFTCKNDIVNAQQLSEVISIYQFNIGL